MEWTEPSTLRAEEYQCTLLERNRLLLAAHTFPVELYLQAPALERVLCAAIDIARVLSMPAMIINRDWRIHYETLFVSNHPPQILTAM